MYKVIISTHRHMYQGDEGYSFEPNDEMSNIVEGQKHIDLPIKPSNMSMGRITKCRCRCNKTNALQTTMLSLTMG
jgi:hypothetical protein